MGQKRVSLKGGQKKRNHVALFFGGGGTVGVPRLHFRLHVHRRSRPELSTLFQIILKIVDARARFRVYGLGFMALGLGLRASGGRGGQNLTV